MAGRKALQAPEPGTGLQVAPTTPPEIAAQEVSMRAAAEAFGDDQRAVTLMIGERRGRRSVLASLAKLVTVTDLEDLKRIKESKAYVGYQYRDSSGELVTVTTWEGYCVAVEGRSVESIDNDLKNYAALGAECFDALRTLGIGPAKMRDLRRAALPEASTAALIELAQAGDKDAVLDLAEDLIAAHAAEKKSLQKAADKATEKLDSLAGQVADQAEQIEQLKADKARLRREWSKKDADERVAALQNAVTEAKLGVIADLSLGDAEAGLHGAIQELLADDTAEQDHTEFLAGVFAEIITAVRQLRDNLPLAVPVRESRK